MNTKVLDFIQQLSLADKKTLSQKALKVAEETGELAKTVLPYDNAPTTTHRFIAKDKILEEVSDTILTAISIAYELGYTHEDIEDMMYHKAVKWQGLQAREKKVTYPLPYEIHVTISNPEDIEQYRQDCTALGVKPIILDLENNEKTTKDVMTSSKYYGNNRGAFEDMKRISKGLTAKGYTVVREKIETTPWHPAAPHDPKKDHMPKDCYYECHIGCIITPTQKTILETITKKHQAHLSRNYFKKLEQGKFVQMITLRVYGRPEVSYTTFKEQVEKLKQELQQQGIPQEKEIIEFSIYDTKISHDDSWIRKG